MPEIPESPSPRPRVVKAPNRGPFTLDGTRTYLVGRKDVAVIDPGPDVESHVRALYSALSSATRVRILLTHHHGDHSGAAAALGRALRAPVLGPPSTEAELLAPGQEVDTDQGTLVVVHTPGHTRDHVSFHWPRARALFVGDLVLGRGTTTWLGEYPGCVADYLASLDQVAALAPEVLYPVHGRPLRDVVGVVEAYRNHRLERLEQLRKVREAAPHATPQELLHRVYGRELPERVRKAAEASIRVMLHHLEEP